jgi:hypothetical protein
LIDSFLAVNKNIILIVQVISALQSFSVAFLLLHPGSRVSEKVDFLILDPHPLADPDSGKMGLTVNANYFAKE